MSCHRILFLLILTLAVPAAGLADGIAVCPAAEGVAGQFADCTRADCTWDGTSDVMTCLCLVRAEIASATTGACEPGASDFLQSRYPGVSSMGLCTSATHPWGDCLGVPCTGANDNGVTACSCDAVTSEDVGGRQYVIVGKASSGAAEACGPGSFPSSATPAAVYDASKALGSGIPQIAWVFP